MAARLWRFVARLSEGEELIGTGVEQAHATPGVLWFAAPLAKGARSSFT